MGMIVVLAAASIFYLWALGRADIITDESSLATRAIKMVDFDFGIEQPTPWQWTDRLPENARGQDSRLAVPWWMRLSFHDHPPLVFLAQHFSMRLFGQTPFAIRLPSVIAGLGAVVLVYLIAKHLYSPAVGLASAALFAFSANHIWISRIGLQESILIALALASVYCFSRLLIHPASVSIGRPIGTGKNRSGDPTPTRWFAASAVFLGLAFLTKYLALILIPIYLTILLTRREGRHLVTSSSFLISVLIFIAVASPVIIYNFQLYRNFGHFDFQFSQLFGQDVKEWQARPGQEVLGSYMNRIKNYMPRLAESNSPYFLALAAAGLVVIIGQSIRRRNPTSHLPLLTSLLWLLPFLVFVGPAYRFLTLLTPWLAVAAGYFLIRVNHWLSFSAAAPQLTPIPISEHSNILKNVRMFRILSGELFAALVMAVLIIVEIFYSYNSVIALKPAGRAPWTHAQISRYNNSWGFNELDEYLGGKLESKMPEVGLTFEFPFAKKILDQAAREGEKQKREALPLAIVYNDNINLSAQLWVFLRRMVYEGWPVTSAENFRRGGQEFLTKAGVKKVIFVNPTTAALQDRSRPNTSDGDILEEQLRAKGAGAEEIKNPKGEVAFKIYEFGFK